MEKCPKCDSYRYTIVRHTRTRGKAVVQCQMCQHIYTREKKK